MTSIKGDIKKAITTQGLEVYAKRFYSFYHARVIDNQDPEQRQRLKLQIKELGVLETDWVNGMGIVANNGVGAVNVPEVGANVLVLFKYGQMRQPFYLAGYHFKDWMPEVFKENYPNRIGMQFLDGNYAYFDKQEKLMRVAIDDFQVNIDAEGFYIGEVQQTSAIAKANETKTQLDSLHDLKTELINLLNTFMTTQQGVAASNPAILGGLTGGYLTAISALNALASKVTTSKAKDEKVKSDKGFIES